MDSAIEGSPQERSESAKTTEDYRKRGGLGSFIAKRPNTPSVFPAKTRTSEGGYGNRKSGYDDSLNLPSQAHGERSVASTEPVDLE